MLFLVPLHKWALPPASHPPPPWCAFPWRCYSRWWFGPFLGLSVFGVSRVCAGGTESFSSWLPAVIPHLTHACPRQELASVKESTFVCLPNLKTAALGAGAGSRPRGQCREAGTQEFPALPCSPDRLRGAKGLGSRRAEACGRVVVGGPCGMAVLSQGVRLCLPERKGSESSPAPGPGPVCARHTGSGSGCSCG